MLFRTFTEEISAETLHKHQESLENQSTCVLMTLVALTVCWYVNSFPFCDPIIRFIHTSQALSLMEEQRKLISQLGVHYVSFVFCVQGCFISDIFRKVPCKVCPNTLPFTVTHCKPERGVFLSHHRHTDMRGF